MGKKIVVENDKVEGKDKHNVAGNATNPAAPPPTIPYKGIGMFDYVGKMTDQLSDFVKIGGKAVALKTSKSSLNPGESAAGKHAPLNGKNWLPPTPAPLVPTLKITDAVGEGRPSQTSGSAFVTINSIPVLLDGDKIDTCDGVVPAMNMNSTVTAGNQDFVSCSG